MNLNGDFKVYRKENPNFLQKIIKCAYIHFHTYLVSAKYLAHCQNNIDMKDVVSIEKNIEDIHVVSTCICSMYAGHKKTKKQKKLP